MKKKFYAIFLGILLIILTCGCVEQEPESNGNGAVEGGVSFTEIQIGDKPTDDFIHVNVTFSEVKLHSNESGWVSIPIDNKTIDLIYLHMNNLNQTLGIGELDEGNYTKLWIVVDNCTGVLNSTKEEVAIDVPSGTLKIQHLFDLRDGNNVITVELDLDSSIKEVGKGKSYKIVPVISSIRVQHQDGRLERIQEQEQLDEITENRPPVIDILVNGSKRNSYNAEINESILFDATGTFDIEDDNITFLWDFGDGTNATNASVTHSYNETGDYEVTLTASDGVDSASETISIKIRESGNHGNGDG